MGFDVGEFVRNITCVGFVPPTSESLEVLLVKYFPLFVLRYHRFQFPFSKLPVTGL